MERNAEYSSNAILPNSNFVKIHTQNYSDFNERPIKDSPYTTSYASKGKKKPSKDSEESKESLRKSIQKVENRGNLTFNPNP